MKIIVSAPTRIDLAGGGLDIPPLFLLHEFGLTLNVAISLKARCEIEKLRNKQIIIESEDLKQRVAAASVSQLKVDKLELLVRLVKFFSPQFGLSIKTSSGSPAGAGIAGSSTLAIALAAGLNRLVGNRYSQEELVKVAKSCETQTIKIPTGFQDYYSALYGGFNAIWLCGLGPNRQALKASPAFIKKFEQSATLVYMGQTRFSGTNNWQLFKDRIDGKKSAINYLDSTKQIALKMQQALARNDFSAFCRFLEQDEKNRVKFFPRIETPQIKKIITASKKAGAYAARVCGAGGGGCLVILAPKDKREEIIKVIKKNKAQVLPFRVARQGVQVREL